MYRVKKELIKSINYNESKYGTSNLLYKSLQNLYNAFVFQHHKELYLVGGCVRDLLLDKKPKDYDLCTNATPDEVKEIIQSIRLKSFDSGIKHGTLTIIDEFFEQSYEITTYRVDGKYSDNRRPDEVTFTPSLEEDLKRRDFTINSFAYDFLNQELVMLDETFLKDLELGIIKCVGDADTRFKEDALRMLRAIRFSAQLGYSIETETFNAIKRNADLIKNISAERIRDELTKIICSDNPHMLEMLVVTGLHKFIIPELEDMLNCKQNNKYHYTDVLHHTFDVIKNLPKNNVRLRWSALFHDMGKPESLSVDEEDYEHFYGHAPLSADKVKKYSEILKFDNNTAEFVYKIVKYHDRDITSMKKKTFKNLINSVGQDVFKEYLMFRQADAIAHNFSAHYDNPLIGVVKAKECYKDIILNYEPMSIKDLVINGYDVMSIGVLSGIEVGKILRLCLKLILEYPELNNKEYLLYYIKQVLQIEDRKDINNEQ